MLTLKQHSHTDLYPAKAFVVQVIIMEYTEGDLIRIRRKCWAIELYWLNIHTRSKDSLTGETWYPSGGECSSSI